MATINGTSGPDNLRGGTANDVLNGLGGNDTLDGGTGVDTLNGGDGNDRLTASSGESAFGGAGNDYVIARGSVAVLDGGAGYDILLGSGSVAGDLAGATITGFEELKADGADMAAWQLGLFATITGQSDTPSAGRLNLIAGGTATVALADSMTRFTLNGSTGDDRLTIRSAYANPVSADLGAGADLFVSGAGNDDLDGGAGADTIRGGAGADTIAAGTGDVIQGEAGDDYIETTADGPLVLSGGAGRDILHLDLNDDISTAAVSEFEELHAGGGALTTTQLAGFGLISGSSGTSMTGSLDLTAGGTATVTLNPALTRMTIVGSAGNEQLTFGVSTGALSLDAAGGADRIIANAGNDTLRGGTGADEIRGGAGDDEIYGYEELGSGNADRSDAAPDRLYGEAGNDRIGVNTGDLGDGGTGNDILEADGAATLLGGDGDDRIVGSTANDSLSGGAGIDTVSYEHSSGARGSVTVSLAIAGAQNTVGGGIDTLTGFENLWGGSGADRLTGDGGNNILTGAAGDDTLDGGAGGDTANYHVTPLSTSLRDDSVTVDLRVTGPQTVSQYQTDTLISIENLIGGESDDTLTGNAGANVIEGGDRNDLLDGQGGTDTASYAGALAAVTVSLALAGAQNTLGAGTDTLIAFENLRGSAFGDVLTGSAGANQIEGLGGNDTLVGGAGIDTLVGGDGNDLYTYDGVDIITETATGGTDRVQSATSYTLGTGLENLTLTGSAAASGTGNASANTLVGNSAANLLTGLGGNDVLSGGAGIDTLVGGDGDDLYTYDGADIITETASGGTDRVQSATSYTLGANLEHLTLTGTAAASGTGNAAANALVGNGAANTLSGGAGNDTLTGGAGTDRLDGGAGADVFDFNAEAESSVATPDVIVLFEGAGGATGDRIDLAGIDANLSLAGDQAFAFNSTATGGLSLTTSGTDTLIRGNTDADATFEFTIRITDGATLATAYTAADFIL